MNTLIVLVLADALSNGDSRIALGMRLAAVVLCLNGVGQLGVELALANGHITLFNLSRLGYTVLPSLIILGLGASGTLTTVTAYCATLAGQVATVVVGVVITLVLGTKGSAAPTPWRDSLHLWSASAVDSVAGQLGQLVLAALSTASQVGIYSIAVMLGAVAGGLAQALTQVSYSRFLAQARSEVVTSAKSLVRLTIIGVASTLIVGVLLIAFVKLFGTVLFGPTFDGLALVTAAAMFSQILSDQWNLRVMFDTANRQVSQLIIASAAGAVTTGVLTVILVLTESLAAPTMALALAGGAASKIGARALISRKLRSGPHAVSGGSRSRDLGEQD
ncbi:hypothetical protein Q9R20_12115 [Microbacterium sp. PRF11]|uniref:lipopolysaccharide biosynthesis protein n=1 Tax=Microbacterium sp. PRF11 TaxID=2962593 RepID=UPI002881D065|nr:hypothetical protein [Microbacterium sp. PRF11]MDT0117735.1 hypothetical protein [Microbacterium sp. PRF11]